MTSATGSNSARGANWSRSRTDRLGGLLFVLALHFCVSVVSAQEGVWLTGRVVDSDSLQPVIAANIRIASTARGTITNTEGRFRLRLDSGRHEIIFSSLGFLPDTLLVTPVQDTSVEVRLTPSMIEVPEVVVLAEDPAIEIIRKAIASKHLWREKLHSYRFDAFTRSVLRKDTSIASITESYSTGYMNSGDTLREIIKQKRQTVNIPVDENFASVGRILNFNDDEISIFQLSANEKSGSMIFTGPTAPNALDQYDYHLVGTSRVSGHDIYTIRMTPKSRIRPLFDGTISIVDGTFAVMGVDVRPNETLVIPFLRDINLRYRQKFSPVDSVFWMPTDIRITGSLRVSIIGFSLPGIAIEQTSSIYDYAMNVPIPDSILHRKRLTVDSSAVRIDSAFWKENDILPLTAEEQSAYRTLDSTQTLEEQFKPKGALSSLAGNTSEQIFGNLDLRFNRVEGFYFGLRKEQKNIIPGFRIEESAGYAFSGDRFMYELEGAYSLNLPVSLTVRGSLYRSLVNVPDDDPYGTLPLSLIALIDKNDYRDYSFAAGWSGSLTARAAKELNITATFRQEQHYSMSIATDYSLFSRENVYRPNPAVQEGLLRSIQAEASIGGEQVPLDLVSGNRAFVSMEYSSPAFMKSEFDFVRTRAGFQYNIPTFARSLLFSPSLRISVTAGTSTGALPPQRMYSANTRAGILAPYGVLRGSADHELTGNRMLMINIEHNFRSIPFIFLNIPSFYKNGIELIVDGSAAQTWNGSESTSGGWYYEAGLGINRVLDVLRFDLTYRFHEGSGLRFTLSTATLF